MVAGQAPGSSGWGEALCSGPLAQLEQIHCPDHGLEGASTGSWREGGRAGPALCHPAAYLQALPCCPRALLYLQELAAEELMPTCQPPAPAEGAPEPEPEHVQRKRRSRRRKEEDTDSDDPAQDADFVPSQEVLRAEEEEGSDTQCSEASEPELEAPRGHGGRTVPTGVRAGAGGLPGSLPPGQDS